MDTSLIGKFDKSRYELMKWFTLGWIIWCGTFIAKDFISNNSIIALLLIAGLVGWMFFTINLIRLVRLGRKINEDSTLKEALNNEMHQFYMHKSFVWGFWTSIATVCLLIVITLFFKVAALMACEVILFVGVTSSLIAHLVYNKE